MKQPFAINGLGRIGRALVRIAHLRDDLELVAINDPAAPEVLARLLRNDTLHGRFPGEVSAEPDRLIFDGRVVPLWAHSTPAEVPWSTTGARLVVEATGQFRSRQAAAGHLGEGVEQVVVSSTADQVDATFCVGINHREFDPLRHQVVSNASCTTNCLAAVVRVLDEAFGVDQALMSTVHCYTNSQRLVDMAHTDPRRARAAALNIIPTTSDAQEAIGEVIPHLAGKIGAVAYRVPISDGSLIDLCVHTSRKAPLDEVRDAFLRASAQPPLSGILATTDEELVSSDFIGDSHSAIVDLPLLRQQDDKLLRVVAWYDNEWGYAHRLAELIAWMGEQS